MVSHFDQFPLFERITGDELVRFVSRIHFIWKIDVYKLWSHYTFGLPTTIKNSIFVLQSHQLSPLLHCHLGIQCDIGILVCLCFGFSVKLMNF